MSLVILLFKLMFQETCKQDFQRDEVDQLNQPSFMYIFIFSNKLSKSFSFPVPELYQSTYRDLKITLTNFICPWWNTGLHDDARQHLRQIGLM